MSKDYGKHHCIYVFSLEFNGPTYLPSFTPDAKLILLQGHMSYCPCSYYYVLIFFLADPSTEDEEDGQAAGSCALWHHLMSRQHQSIHISNHING